MKIDTVVVAAGAAWDYYLRHSAYVCQAGRSFRPVERMAFYRRKRIEPLIPKVLDRRDHVRFTRENAADLASRGQPFDADIARVIVDSLDEGSRHDGDEHGVFVLTRPDDPRTQARAGVLPHDARGAWTMGQRYADSDHLLSAHSTSDLGTSSAGIGESDAHREDMSDVTPSIARMDLPPGSAEQPLERDQDRCFVQFMHPGGEHGEDRPGFKDWNVHDHRRKFIRIGGQYLRRLSEAPRHQDIVFWGEWEPESTVEPIAAPVPGGPRWVHVPYYLKPDSYKRDGRVLQNTDPYVFGGSFQYTLCRQLRRGRPTFLRDLAPGSLVLFGSLKDRGFVLDTVFVVADSVLHTDEDWPRALDDRIDDTYADVTIRPAYEWGGAELRHYRGATHPNPVGGMFSFVPCLPSADDHRGFARPAIHLDGVMTANLMMGAKSTRDLPIDEVHELWRRVVEQVLAQGLCLGVEFDTPGRMSSSAGLTVPDYVAARIRTPPPEDSHVLPRSTPVAAFGDPGRARVATLGLNPSRIEFYEKDRELDGRFRRFETLDSLGLDTLETACDEAVERVWKRCVEYFRGNPYRRWFMPLEKILNAAGASYFDDSACHLDLTQWATDPTWNDVPGHAKARLVASDLAFLRRQLETEGIELLLLNGRGVLDAFTNTIGKLRQHSSDVHDRGVTARIYTGEIGNAHVIGWSTNLQSSRGVTTIFRQRLAERVAELAGAS